MVIVYGLQKKLKVLILKYVVFDETNLKYRERNTVIEIYEGDTSVKMSGKPMNNQKKDPRRLKINQSMIYQEEMQNLIGKK